MRKSISSSLLCALILSSQLHLGFTQVQPNILWIMAEDMSPDIKSYGSMEVETPTLNTLAKEGVMFTRAFSTNPVCSPSSSAVVTGTEPTFFGLQNHRTGDKLSLPKGTKNLGTLLTEAGYFVGQMGQSKTDYNFSGDQTASGIPFRDWNGRAKNQPFFAYFKYSETHRSQECDQAPDVIDHSKLIIPPYQVDTKIFREDHAKYLNCIESLDKKISALLKRLDTEGLTENTVVAFHSDHGRPQIRDKQWLYDGGTHIPFIIRWPGKITPASKRDELINLIDLTTTTLAIAGAEIPAYYQGRDLFSKTSQERQYLIAVADRHDERIDRLRSVRTKRFRYIRNMFPELPWTWSQKNAYKDTEYPVFSEMKQLFLNDKLNSVQAALYQPFKPVEELFDVQKDPWNTINLAKNPAYADTLLQMRSRLQSWMQSKHPIFGYYDKGAVAEENNKMWIIRQYADGTGKVHVTATIDDSQGREASVNVEYSLNEGKQWFKAILDKTILTEYGSVSVDNSKMPQISGLSNRETGANTFRFMWDTYSPENGGGSLKGKKEPKVQLRLTTHLGQVIVSGRTYSPKQTTFMVDNTLTATETAPNIEYLPPEIKSTSVFMKRLAANKKKSGTFFLSLKDGIVPIHYLNQNQNENENAMATIYKLTGEKIFYLQQGK